MKTNEKEGMWTVSQACRETGLSRKVITGMPDKLPFLEVDTGGFKVRRFKPQAVRDFIERNTKRA